MGRLQQPGDPSAWILPPSRNVLLVPSRMWETLLHLEPLLSFEAGYEKKALNLQPETI